MRRRQGQQRRYEYKRANSDLVFKQKKHAIEYIDSIQNAEDADEGALASVEEEEVIDSIQNAEDDVVVTGVADEAVLASIEEEVTEEEMTWEEIDGNGHQNCQLRDNGFLRRLTRRSPKLYEYKKRDGTILFKRKRDALASLEEEDEVAGVAGEDALASEDEVADQDELEAFASVEWQRAHFFVFLNSLSRA